MNFQKSENQNIEFKESWRDEYLQWICAFANSSGGTLYIGVCDNGLVKGVNDSKKLLEDIPNKIRSTMGLIPEINLLTDGDKEYIQIKVEKCPFPVSCKGKYYKRAGSTTQELTGAELDKLILFMQGRTWDSIPVPNVSVDDLENDAIKLFKKKASESGRLDRVSLDVSNETLIQNLHLIENGYLNRAAILSFHPDPEKWITGAYIKVAFFENDADILYQDEIHGSLITQVEKTIDLIYTKYMKALISYNDIYRKETFFFPRAAFRELLLNAAVHKDYMSTTPIQIRIYKDKIRLWNDGKLPEEITPENLFKEHISKPHNPNLANVFFKCGMIESWGRGYEKIENYCKEENAVLPQIDLSLGGITIRCFASETYLNLAKTMKVDETSPESNELPQNFPKTSQRLPKELSDSVKRTFIAIKQNPDATLEELSETLGITDRSIKSHIAILKEEGFIIRDGGKTYGRWKIIKEEE